MGPTGFKVYGYKAPPFKGHLVLPGVPKAPEPRISGDAPVGGLDLAVLTGRERPFALRAYTLWNQRRCNRMAFSCEGRDTV